jgi:nucleotide-binding universal stress UspA family protein
MIDVIAVGTDGSATADKAVEFAIELASRHEAELVVLSAYSSQPSALVSAAMAAAWVRRGRSASFPASRSAQRGGRP